MHTKGTPSEGSSSHTPKEPVSTTLGCQSKPFALLQHGITWLSAATSEVTSKPVHQAPDGQQVLLQCDD